MVVMRRLVILLALVGCTSASSSGRSLAPGQISAEDPSFEGSAPQPLPPPGPSSPPPESGALPGCPSLRSLEEDPSELASADDFRARIVGIYRSCSGARIGMEIRIDPEDPARVLWWELDERFVRMNGSGMSGWFEPDAEDCSGLGCRGSWFTDTLGLGNASQITVWSDPIAIEIQPDMRTTSRTEWVRVAD